LRKIAASPFGKPDATIFRQLTGPCREAAAYRLEEAAGTLPAAAADRQAVAGIPRRAAAYRPEEAVADTRQPEAVGAARTPRTAAGQRRPRAKARLFRQRQRSSSRPRSSEPPQNEISFSFADL